MEANLWTCTQRPEGLTFDYLAMSEKLNTPVHPSSVGLSTPNGEVPPVARDMENQQPANNRTEQLQSKIDELELETIAKIQTVLASSSDDRVKILAIERLVNVCHQDIRFIARQSVSQPT